MMRELPPPPGTAESAADWLKEIVWHEKGGIAPESVTDSIDKEVLSTALELSPRFRSDWVRLAREDYPQAEVTSVLIALSHLDLMKIVYEWPVPLAQICSGPFVDIVTRIDQGLKCSNEQLTDPLGYVQFLGRDVVQNLKSSDLISFRNVSGGDEYTLSGAYVLTSKGGILVKAIREQDALIAEAILEKTWLRNSNGEKK